MKNNLTVLISLLFLASCSSSKVIPTTDVCSLKKHYKDNIFQVLINKKPINDHYYIFDEAKEVTEHLAKENQCMP